MTEKIIIELPKGGALEVDAEQPAFYDTIRKCFDIEGDVTHDHVRMFIFGAVNNAVVKATPGETQDA